MIFRCLIVCYTSVNKSSLCGAFALKFYSGDSIPSSRSNGDCKRRDDF